MPNRQMNVASESEMPPMLKKDFYEFINNNDEAYIQKQKQIINLTADLDIETRENKALKKLLDDKIAENELLISNKKIKNEKSSQEIQNIQSKSREKKEYIDKNMSKLVQQQIDSKKDRVEAFEKKYGTKI